MSDIVERLRVGTTCSDEEMNKRHEAADEIERLRAALRDLLTPQTPASFAGAMRNARAALGEKE